MDKKTTLLFTTISLATLQTLSALEEMPMHAQAGQCFTKSFTAPRYTKTTKIKSSKRVVVSEESVKYEVIPAKYAITQKRVKISDGIEKIIATPAVYKTVSERILVEPEKLTWRKNLSSHAPKAFDSCVQSAENLGMNTKNATVGTCFYEHYQPEKYINTTSKILASEASQRVVVTPAKYRTVTKKIVTDNTTAKLLPSAAVYKKVKDRVAVEPAHTEWKKTTCNNRGCNQSEVVCLIEVPTQYKEVTKKIVLQPAVKKTKKITPTYKTIKVQELIRPATTKIIPIPAKYKTISQRKKVKDSKYFWSDSSLKNAKSRITNQCNKICLTKTPAVYKTVSKKIVVTPASSKKVKTPAKYTTVNVKKVIKEASYKKVIIPKEYITVVTERERTKGYAKWQPMVCEENMTEKTIKKVQRALQFNGFYQGAIDGKWNTKLRLAVRAYQKEHNLAVSSKLTIETMKALAIY
jgi:hypothetical protein